MPKAKGPGRKPRPDKKSKQADVVRLAGTGLTWRAIAEKVRVPLSTAVGWYEEYYEEEHALLHDDADRIRKQQTATLQRQQRLAERIMLDSITTQETDDGEKVILSDPETFSKLGNLVAKYAAQIALMNGANKPLKIDMEGGGLPPDVFAQLAEARMMKRANAKPV